jgi:type VI secretion system secreted protein VgrG
MAYRSLLYCGTAVVLGLLGAIQAPERAAAADLLGTAANFAVLGASTVANTGTTTINGDLGVASGSAINGIGGINLTGTVHLGDALTAQAETDAMTAYNGLKGLTATQNLTGQDLGGLTLTQGVYKFDSTAGLTGGLVLNFSNASNEDIVFQIGTALTTASASSVTVENGNSSDHVYFQVGSSATLGSGTMFAGDILALASITMDSGAQILSGRALALTGMVTMNDSTIIAPNVSAVPLPDSLLPFGAAIFGLVGLSMGMKKSRAAKVA